MSPTALILDVKMRRLVIVKEHSNDDPKKRRDYGHCRRGPLLLPIAFLFFLLGDPLDAGELGAFVEVDQAHALRRAPHLSDLLDARAYEDAAGGDEHDLVLVAHQHRADDLAVALGGLDRDHPLRASSVARVLGDRGALAE